MLKVYLLTFFALIVVCPSAMAQEIQSLEGNVIKYPPKRGVDFPKASESKKFASVAIVFKESDSYNQRAKEKIDNVYPPRLPECESGRVWRKNSGARTEATSNMDYTFFAADNPEQQESARGAKGKTVPYLAGIGNPTAKSADYRMSLAPVLGVKCLPTRFHFIKDGEQLFAEYREGSEAWR